MAIVSERKTYEQSAEGYAAFVADVSAAHEWAKIENVSETEVKFYDEGGNYIKLYLSDTPQIKIAPYNAKGKTHSDDLATALHVWFVTTKKTFGIFCTNSGSATLGTASNGYIFTDSEGVPTLYGKSSGSGSTPLQLTSYNSTNDTGSVAYTDYKARTSGLIAVAIPVSNKYSRCVCYNLMVLEQNPFDTHTNHGAITLGDKDYYMIGLMLLADD